MKRSRRFLGILVVALVFCVGLMPRLYTSVVATDDNSASLQKRAWQINEDDNTISWVIEVDGGDNVGLAGQTIIDLISMTNHEFNQDNIDSLTIEIQGDDGDYHTLSVDDANLDWSETGWEITLPDEFECVSCRETITLPRDDSTGWVVYIEYTTSITSSGSYVTYSNVVTFDDLEEKAIISQGDGGIDKTGVYNEGTTWDDTTIDWTIDVFIPGGKVYNWYISDTEDVVIGSSSQQYYYNALGEDGTTITATINGETYNVPNLSDAANDGSDLIAWKLSDTTTEDGYDCGRTICFYTWDSTDGNWSQWWNIEDDTYLTITYSSSVVCDDENLIEKYNTKGASLQNSVTLKNNGPTGTDSNDVDEASAAVLLPSVIDKELTGEPDSNNGYVVEYTVTFNEAMVDLSGYSEVVIMDTTSSTLVFDRGSLVIAAKDAEGNTYTVTDYTVTYSSGTNNVATISMDALALGPYEYTLVYNAQINGSGTISYSNVIEVEVLGITFTDEVGGVDVVVTAYAVNVANSENGTVVPDKSSAAAGATVTLTVTADDGYELETLLINNCDVAYTDNEDGTYTFTMPASAVTVSATFTPTITDPTTSVTVEETTNGTVTVDNPNAVENDTVTITVTPEDGYAISDLTVTDESSNDVLWTYESDGTYTFTMPDSAVTVSVEMAGIRTVYATKITEVPTGLMGEYSSPEEIEDALLAYVASHVSSYDGTAIYDVSVEMYVDGNWEEITEDYLQEYGYITVVLPYPTGTDSSYNFTAYHMFTYDIGTYTAGDIENCSAVNTEDGLQIMLHGLSPVIVTWTASGTTPIDPPTPTQPTKPTYDYDGEVSYRITTSTTSHGTIEVSDTRAYEGDKVTITVIPDDGYELESLTVTNVSTGKTIKLTEKSDGVYTFTMSDSKATIEATFVKIAEEETETLGTLITIVPTTSFTDISNSRYKDAIAYVYDAGLMNGMTATTFEPDSTLTRGMIVTALYRLAGEPEVSGSSTFADVADGQWYTNAIIWATENGIVNGYGNGNFGPNDEVTREQMMALFYRYASQNGYYMGNTFALDGFTDNAAVSAYAVTALEWGFANSMIQSRITAMINPTDAATRAEVAQALYILIK